MENIIFITIGIIDLILVIKIKINPEFAANYVKNSPKAYLWRKIFGEEKALRVIKNIFVPIGFIFGIVLIGLGIMGYI